MNKTEGYEPDLDIIEPRLRSVVRARLHALEAYETNPTREHAEELAKGVGLGPSQFYNLLKAWRNLKDPSKLAGLCVPRGRQILIGEKQSRFIAKVLADNPTKSGDDLARIVLEQAALCDVEMPNWDKVRRYVHAHRPRKLPPQLKAAGDLIVEYTVIEPAVSFANGSVERPLATIVIDTHSEQIISLVLSRGAPSVESLAKALVLALPSSNKERACSISLPGLTGPRWRSLVTAFEQAGFDMKIHHPGAYGHGQGAQALLGLFKDGIRLRPRLVEADPARRAKGIANKPVLPSLEEATSLVRARLDINAPQKCDIESAAIAFPDLFATLQKLSQAVD